MTPRLVVVSPNFELAEATKQARPSDPSRTASVSRLVVGGSFYDGDVFGSQPVKAVNKGVY